MSKKSLEENLKTIQTEALNNPRTFAVRSLKAQADAKRTPIEKLADWLTTFFGTVSFLVINVIVFVVWIVVNNGGVPGVAVFDPFPYVLLTTTVSLEAIVLAIIVLISQNRAARISDVREEIDLHVNRIAEAEVTQILRLLTEVAKKSGINTDDDPEIQRMLRPIRNSDIQRKVEQQTDPKNNSEWEQLARQIPIHKLTPKK